MIGTYSRQIWAIDSNNNSAYSALRLFVITNDFVASADGPYSGWVDEPLQFNGYAVNGFPPYSWYWDFGDGNTSNIQNPIHTYTNAGNYTVILTVTDDESNTAINTTWANIIGDVTPDLDCDGSLSWTDVTPGEARTSYFTVENIGEPESLLDWEIESHPDWGDWTFTPDSGDDLLPNTPVTIGVTVIAPDEQEETFTGEVVLVNSEDPDDTCVIDVSLATPVNQQVQYPFIQWVLERFPNAFPILRYLLGL